MKFGSLYAQERFYFSVLCILCWSRGVRDIRSGGEYRDGGGDGENGVRDVRSWMVLGNCRYTGTSVLVNTRLHQSKSYLVRS